MRLEASVESSLYSVYKSNGVKEQAVLQRTTALHNQQISTRVSIAQNGIGYCRHLFSFFHINLIVMKVFTLKCKPKHIPQFHHACCECHCSFSRQISFRISVKDSASPRVKASLGKELYKAMMCSACPSMRRSA